MNGYLFILGNTPHLSQAELSVFFPTYELICPDVANVEQDLDATQWIGRLGGTVKIAKVIAGYAVLDPVSIAWQLQKISSHRFSFGMSSYSKDFRVQTAFLQQVKDELIAGGKSLRFVAPREGNVLSSVVVVKQELIELVVVGKEGRWLVGQTVAVQDFEEWNRRDYGRPAAEPKAGMLPPKVARMAVNLAVGGFVIPAKPAPAKAGEPGSSFKKEWIPDPCDFAQGKQARNDIHPVLLDPFCGMGTVLAEALMTGWSVIGSDVSAEVIEKTRKNLEWLMSELTGSRLVRKQGETPPNWRLLLSDATHVSEKLQPASVDAIVTEPFMGNTRLGGNDQFPMTNGQFKNTIKGLEKLYIGCLKDWRMVLKPGGLIVMALPKYSMHGREFFVKKVIDTCESLGYTVSLGPIEYSRPHAVVRRTFYVFQKKVKLA